MSLSKASEIILPISTPLSPQKAQRKPKPYRKEATVFLGEFIGTFMFLFLAFAGTQIASESVNLNQFTSSDNKPLPETSKLLYIAFSFGAALAVNVAIFADVSGGMFNPAVTAALWIVGMIRWQRALHSILAQLVAGMTAAAVVAVVLPGPLPVATTLDPSMSLIRGLFLEAILTAQLILTVLMLPAGPSKPMYVGTALFIAEICGAYLTGGSLNPARSLGPAIVNGFDSNHWIYWIGPAIGAGLGAGAFAVIHVLRDDK